MPTGQTDRWTDARPLHYAFRYKCSQLLNKEGTEYQKDNESLTFVAEFGSI